MIKAVAGDLLIFGLSDTNLALLKEGRPILFDLKELGKEGRVFIFHGATVDQMREQLKEFVGPNTIITDDRKKPS